MTSLQQEAWIAGLGDRGDDGDHGGVRAISVLLRLAAVADAEPVHAALRDVVRRHDALRTSFTAGDPRRCQIADPADASVGFTATGTEPGAAELDGYLTRPFPLGGCERVRAWLFPDPDPDPDPESESESESGPDPESGPGPTTGSGGGGAVLAVAADHLAMDFVSLRLALRELAHGARDTPPYAAFAAAQRERMAGRWGAERRAFWFGYFDTWGAGRPRTPLARPRADRSAAHTVRSHTRVDEAVRRAIDTVAARHRTTAFAVLAAAVLLAQTRWSGAGTPAGVVTDFHGRVFPGTHGIVGLFSHGTRLPMRAGEAADLDAAVRLVAARLADVRAHALPLRPLAAQWAAGRPAEPDGPGDLDDAPYVYVGARARRSVTVPGAPGTGRGLAVRDVRLRTAANEAARDLSVILTGSYPDLHLTVRHDRAHFRDEDVEALLAAAFDAVRGAAGTARHG